jgi:hypothetical protein
MLDIDSVWQPHHARRMILAVGGVACVFAIVVTGCGAGGSVQPSDGPRAIDAGIDGPGPTDGPVGSDAAIDAGIDAAPDSPPALARYDVAYIDDFTMEWNRVGFVSFVVIVNQGAAPLDLTKVAVIDVTDDHREIESRFQLSDASATQLEPGEGAGRLSFSAANQLVASGLVPERIVDDALDFRLSFPGMGQPGVDLHVAATLRIEDAQIVLPFTIHFIDEPRVSLDHAARLLSYDRAQP